MAILPITKVRLGIDIGMGKYEIQGFFAGAL
jgi:hypothetical protein